MHNCARCSRQPAQVLLDFSVGGSLHIGLRGTHTFIRCFLYAVFASTAGPLCAPREHPSNR